MPTNVSHEFAAAQKKYDAANTRMEKLAALQEMRSTAPKHKGGENLRAEISRKISQLKKELERQKIHAKKVSKGKSLNVKKEGVAQVVLVGLPNSGKSTFLKKLTNAEVEIAPHPFTTVKPVVGMMNYKNALVQLVEVPAIIEGSSKGKANGIQLLSIVRNADAIVFVLTKAETEKEKKILLTELDNIGIKVNKEKPKIEIKHSKFSGLSIAGKRFLKVPEETLTNFLKSAGVNSSSIILNENTTMEKITEILDDRIVYKKALFVESTPDIDWEKLKEKIFFLLNKLLVYTKKPGKEAKYDEPLVLNQNATVGDVAKLLHKDFAKNLKYAKVWGSAKFPGQRVSKSFKLKNQDLIEIYA